MDSTLAAAVCAGPDSRDLTSVAVTDGAGTIVGWTDGAERLLGYRAEAVVNRPVNCLLVPTAQGAGFDNLGSTHYWSGVLDRTHCRGTILGVAVFARTDNPTPFTRDDLLLAEELVARLSGGRAVEVASTYLPTDQHAGVGGDWYDVIPLPDGGVALVVGDVVGHGFGAAATMGRARTAVHTLAGLGLAPHEVIAQLDTLAPHLSSMTRICSFARAGHPPPAILAPDGKVTFPDVPTGGPIGLGVGQYASLDVRLAEGSVIAMFTDGLIETRADGIDVGLDRLGGVLAGTTRELEDICAYVIDSMRRETSPNDDVALLLAHTRAAGDDVS